MIKKGNIEQSLTAESSMDVAVNSLDEVNRLLVEASARQKQKATKCISECVKEFSLSVHAGDVVAGGAYIQLSVNDNLRNMLAIAETNMLAGLYAEYKNEVLERDLKAEKALKHAAFLFILQKGLKVEFAKFMSEHDGKTDGILLREMCK